MTTLGIIGSGNIGTAVARLAVGAGINVVIANSRGPESLADLVDELGEHATAATIEDAARSDTAVLLSIPLSAYPSLPQAVLSDRTVLDTGNYYPSRDGRIADLDSGRYTQLQLAQTLLPGAILVKAFSNILAPHIPQLARPSGAADRTALPIASDDPDALELAASLIDRIGFDTLDAGPASQTWRFEPESAGYTQIYLSDPTVSSEQFWITPAAPVSKDMLRAALASATRVDVADRTA
ncbi:NAD(P)-binding domain-containing protein [Mycolicibacterium mucogenicum]|uniref:NADPH-dependent F420 reductase n=1 Tax=Mycolicibacterium mucogenicum TaxID=56689 RepID=UPI00226AB767|nr:NAD(P)-binding domain-containing protein [Mycolicibacterium mucogenicum]MCX8562875.1 NAD(P)-binding domain-containing protein [Mycolicibacterium mucogenicum]